MGITKASEKDIPELCELNDYIRKYPGHLTKFVDPEWIGRHLNDYYVIRDGNVITAAACVNLNDDHGKLRVLSVRNGFQRQGLGTAMVQHAILLSKRAGLPVLRAGSAKRFKAQGFYLKCGFKIDDARSTEENDEFEMNLDN